MHVANVIPDGRIGGPQLRARAVMERLVQHGIKTTVVLPEHEDEAFKYLTARGLPATQLRFYRPRLSRDPRTQLPFLSDFILGIMRFTRYLRKTRTDLVHLNGLLSAQVAFAAKLAGCALVWHLNDVAIPRAMIPPLRTLVINLSDAIAISSKAVGEYYLGDGQIRPPIHLLYPPVDTAKIKPEARSGLLRNQFGLDQEAILVANVGNINPLKGHLDLARAAAKVVGQCPQTHFVIIGPFLPNRDDYTNSFLILLNELNLRAHFHFTGYRSDIPECLADIDLLVHPALTEAAGMVLMEAMAAGKPIVATQVGGIPELVSQGRSGLLVEKSDSEALANALLWLIERPRERENFGKCGRADAIEKFDVEQAVQSHIKIYCDVLQARCRTTTRANIGNLRDHVKP